MIHKTPLVTWRESPVMWNMTFLGRHIFVGWDWKIDMGKWDEHGMKFYVKGWLLRRGTGHILF